MTNQWNSPPPAERFWSKVDKNGPIPPHSPELGPCWIWLGARFGQGYGAFYLDGRNQRAHRVAWKLGRGALPDGEDCLHRCDNPPCVNYEQHLFLGSDVENAADRGARGRTARGDRSGSRLHPDRLARGERNGAAKLTDRQVEELRARYAAGGVSHRALALEYGVSESGVGAIVNGVTRKVAAWGPR